MACRQVFSTFPQDRPRVVKVHGALCDFILPAEYPARGRVAAYLEYYGRTSTVVLAILIVAIV